METRPALTPALDGTELRRWYWLRDELAPFARSLGLPTGGGKRELTERIAAHLDGLPQPANGARARSTHVAGPLSLDTVLPAGQRSSQALRAWFVGQLGPGFRFDGPMRTYLAEGGHTLGDALDHWRATRGHRTETIEPQFELNRFARAWHAGHPDGSHPDMLAAWRRHRSLPVDAR